ncbi:MAG: PAS domain S-box-containing protein [Planctomycetota bacterium]|jgi:PAS domain S-box-containing protein
MPCMCARSAAHLGLLRICFVLAALASALTAQSYSARVYTEADGLPHQSILDIAQTADGMLWFSTSAGLATYDGRSFEPVALGQRLRGRASRFQMDTDDVGRLWAFETDPPYIGRLLIDGSWQQLPDNDLVDADARPANLSVACVAQKNGDYFALLGCDGGGLWLLSPSGWRRVPIESEFVRSICVLDDNFVIAGAHGVALLPIASPQAQPTPITEIPDGGTLAVAFDESQDLCWILGRTWIGQYRHGQFNLLRQSMKDPFLPAVINVALLPDEHGGVYFGERAGCLHFSPSEGLETFEQTDGLDDIGITRLVRDREGIIWAGGVRGVAKFAGRSLVNRSSKHGLAEDEVSAILQLRDGRMVLGHDMSITVLESPPRTVTLNSATAFTRIMAMVQAEDGSIIAAASSAGLLRIDPDTLAFETIPGPPIPGRAIPGPGSRELQATQSVSKAPNGDIIVASWRNAWWLRVNGQKELVDLSKLPTSISYLRQIVVDGEGILCAARTAGVVQFLGTEMRQWTADGQATQNITCVTRRPDGSIWAGSAAGLVEANDDGTLRHRDFGGELITTTVYSITDDNQGRTWFGTNDGVIIWDGTRLRAITSDKGLAGRETNRGANYCDSDGHVWVGFDHGLTTFHLDREVAPRHGPTIAFLPPYVDGVATAGDDWQQLDDHRSITFRLQSISTRDEGRLLHEYRLEGIDEAWSPRTALPNNQILYHSLPEGHYRLHVRATDSAGLNTTAVSPWLEVMPPWWRSWWFALTVAAAALAMVGFITLYASQRRHTHLLTRTVVERTANLTTERNRLHAMLTSIDDGVIGVDKDSVIRVWNPTATSLTGWNEEDTVGTHLDELLPPLDAPHSSQPGQPVQIVTQNGASRWFEFTTARVSNDENSDRVIAFRDVTNRRQQEQLLTRTERLESLGILAGGIAHDFNNLLTVMLGNLSLLELDDLTPDEHNQESKQLHEQIHDAVLRARDLTQQLLTFSKGGAPVRKLGSLTDVIAESAQLALSGANVRSETSIDEELHAVEFDFGQISQVIHNLVLNARQAMPDGGTVTLRGFNVDCSPQGTMAKYAVIEIHDDGTGIPPSELEHIFDPYFSTKPEGTGLGLATSHSIIKRHEGFLTAESRVGRGTTLRIYLPAGSRAPSQGQHTDRLRAAAPRPATASNRRVLCMDDDEGIRSVVAASMQTLGHRAVVVADGKAAVTAYREAVEANNPFDYVLLDLTIPGGMGGIETLEQLQHLNPNVVAIATTGYSTEPVRAEFQQHGFCVMLSKPFGINDVDAALSQAAELTSRPDPKKGGSSD